MSLLPFKTKNIKIGLALGEGAARGLAHIGVLNVLVKAQVPIKVITGTSMGALIGGLFAAGIHPEKMEHLVTKERLKVLSKVFVPTFPRGGFFDGNRITELLESIVGAINIEDLKIPYAAIATNFANGEEVILRKGPLTHAIRASSSIPGIFNPVNADNHILCDGALTNPVPVDVCRKLGADKVIAVNVNPRLDLSGKKPAIRTVTENIKKDKADNESWDQMLLSLVKHIDKSGEITDKVTKWIKPLAKEHPKISIGIIDAITQAFSIMYAQSVNYTNKSCVPDVLLQPDTKNFYLMDFDKAEELIEIGQNCALAQIKNIIKMS
ncbi:patatin-like phospholipase family protein [candidate division KSB1 bacterium]|nr:patatin-like phospholipase family protein [candidate division KSB1 bacterium]